MSPSSPTSPRPPDGVASTSSPLVSAGPLGSSDSSESAGDILEPCHIDRLPTELLVSILSHLLPPPSILLHQHRLRVIHAPLAVTLVSRRFHVLARDYLWRGARVQVEVDSTCLVRGADLLRRLPRLAQDCRELEMFFMHDLDSVDTYSLDAWATRMPNAQRLSLRLGPRFDLADAAHFRALRHLSIYRCDLDLGTRSVFPALESMRLNVEVMTPRLSLFNKTVFPAPRRLNVEYRLIEEQGHGSTVLPIDFLAQLGYVEVASQNADPADHARLVPVEQLTCRTPILWRLDLQVPHEAISRTIARTPPAIPHAPFLLLDLRKPYGATRDWTERALAKVRTLLEPPFPPHLRLVLVPAEVWDPPAPEATRAHEAATRALQNVCAQQGVTLRTYEERRTNAVVAVPEFLAFLREEEARGEGQA